MSFMDEMREPFQENSPETATLLDAAVGVFAEKGYNGAELSDVAAAAGLPERDLKQFFGDKEELYYQACCFAMERWQRSYSEHASEDLDAHEKLLLLARTQFLYPIEHPETRWLLEDGTLMVLFVSERYTKIVERGKDFLRSILEEGVESGQFRPMDCTAVANALFDLYKYYLLGFYMEPSSVDPQGYVELLADIITKGLLKR